MSETNKPTVTIHKPKPLTPKTDKPNDTSTNGAASDTVGEDEDEEDVAGTTTEEETPVVAKRLTPAEVLSAFLANHGLNGDSTLAVFKSCEISCLDDLLQAKKDPKMRAEVEAELQVKTKFGLKRFQDLEVEAIQNAIFLAKHPDAEQALESLLQFLNDQDVFEAGGREKLLRILLEHDVKSLSGLHKIEASSEKRKVDALAAAITNWNAAAGANFKKITAAEVARAAGGAPREADADLKSFLTTTAKLPAGSEKVLAAYGVTSLEQFKAVKQDPAQSQELGRQLANSGILNAKEAYDKVTVDTIDEEIATASSPATKTAKTKQEALTDAITKVKALRQEVETANEASLAAVVGRVTQSYDSVMGKVKDVCGVSFSEVNTATQLSQTNLKALLDTTIQNAEKAVGLLNSVEKKQLPLTGLVRRLEMLCGALITPAGVIMKHAELVKMPKAPDQLEKAPGVQTSTSIQYKGKQTRSFASSYASETGSAISATAETAGAGFIGGGIGAVSVAGSYSDARKASRDEEAFQSATNASCGELRYLYYPQKTVQFNVRETSLNAEAERELNSIAAAPGPNVRTRIRDFYDRFGSHFFTRYSLGGRYDFEAKGETLSSSGKEKLVTAVSSGTDWAASTSMSYLSMSGAGTIAASVIGSTTQAQARGDRMEFSTDSAKVVVSIRILGGAGIGPREIWAQSLLYNTTWAVIGRDEPMALWDLVKPSEGLTPAARNMAPLLEEVWVREVFRDSVRDTDPYLVSCIDRSTGIKDCKSLYALVEALQQEPELVIAIVERTSDEGQHPKTTAQTTLPGYKLIGGGAKVFYPEDGRAGSLLTGSYPSGNGWTASAKSHLNPSLSRVTAFAIYLVDPDDLWDVRQVSARTPGNSGGPAITATLPPEYALTGGGALVEYSGLGVMLTACCPEISRTGACTGWTAKGKDHLDGDGTGYATAWAIGIRPRKMKPGQNPEPSSIVSQNAQAGHPQATADIGQQRVIVGGGAAVTYGKKGGMLTSTYPSGNRWTAAAKDHLDPDTCDLTTWSIARIGHAKGSDEAIALRARG